MPETEAEREVMQFLVKTFRRQGLRRGTGLQKRMATFLGMSEGALSKKLKKLDVDVDAEQAEYGSGFPRAVFHFPTSLIQLESLSKSRYLFPRLRKNRLSTFLPPHFSCRITALGGHFAL